MADRAQIAGKDASKAPIAAATNQTQPKGKPGLTIGGARPKYYIHESDGVIYIGDDIQRLEQATFEPVEENLLYEQKTPTQREVDFQNLRARLLVKQTAELNEARRRGFSRPDVLKLKRQHEADRADVVKQYIPGRLIGLIFEYMNLTHEGPLEAAMPVAGDRGFLPMIWKEVIVGDSITLKAVQTPMPRLANDEYLRTYVTRRLFAHTYCAHITFDLSNKKLSWQSLVAPWANFWKDIPRILLTIVGIEACHPFAIAEFVQFVSECKLICIIDTRQPHTTYAGQKKIFEELREIDEHDDGVPSILGALELDIGNYIILDVPSVDTHPEGRSRGLIRAVALIFIDALFELGRGLRSQRQKTREQTRTFCFNWMCSDEQEKATARTIARQGVPAKYKAGSYKAWEVHQQKSPSPVKQAGDKRKFFEL